jgi:hypothetical protein
MRLGLTFEARRAASRRLKLEPSSAESDRSRGRMRSLLPLEVLTGAFTTRLHTLRLCMSLEQVEQLCAVGSQLTFSHATLLQDDEHTCASLASLSALRHLAAP